MKNDIGDLMGIALNLWIAFSALTLPINEYGDLFLFWYLLFQKQT
jgi:hypothetical protein